MRCIHEKPPDLVSGVSAGIEHFRSSIRSLKLTQSSTNVPVYIHADLSKKEMTEARHMHKYYLISCCRLSASEKNIQVARVGEGQTPQMQHLPGFMHLWWSERASRQAINIPAGK